MALFLVLAIIQTLISPLAVILAAIGIKGKWNVFKNIAADTNTLSKQWLRIFLEAFISFYMFLLLGF